MADSIDKYQDVIDSRDIIERIAELEALRDETNETATQNPDAPGWLQSCPDEADELEALEALAEQAAECADDWEFGATLIRDSYFTEYAQELLEDCGDLPANLPHYIQIDWTATARNIQVDYSSVEFDGVTYWIR